MLSNAHGRKLLSSFNLRGVSVLMCQVPTRSEGKVAAPNGVRKVRVPKFQNKPHLSGARFLNYLEAVLYGYVRFSLAAPEDAKRFTLGAVSEYLGVCGRLVIRDANNAKAPA